MCVAPFATIAGAGLDPQDEATQRPGNHPGIAGAGLEPATPAL
jgi:hypothetical protein